MIFMKKYILIFIVLFMLSCSKRVVDSNVKSTSPTSVDGFWMGEHGDAFTNAYAQFSEINGRIYMSHFLEFENQPYYEVGVGVRKGDSLLYHVEAKRKIPGWSPEGDHYLKIDESGNKISGYFIDQRGSKGKMIFNRLR